MKSPGKPTADLVLLKHFKHLVGELSVGKALVCYLVLCLLR